MSDYEQWLERRANPARRSLFRNGLVTTDRAEREREGALTMRQNGWRTTGLISALLVSTFILVLSAPSSAAVTTIGADCGVGATLVGGDSAGKVTLGQGVSTCTVSFSATQANAPACTATNETNGGGHPIPVGLRTTTSGIVMDPAYPWSPGDVISYICVGY
jgi:hypothetical protein